MPNSWYLDLANAHHAESDRKAESAFLGNVGHLDILNPARVLLDRRTVLAEVEIIPHHERTIEDTNLVSLDTREYLFESLRPGLQLVDHLTDPTGPGGPIGSGPGPTSPRAAGVMSR